MLSSTSIHASTSMAPHDSTSNQEPAQKIVSVLITIIVSFSDYMASKGQIGITLESRSIYRHGTHNEQHIFLSFYFKDHLNYNITAR